MRILIGLAAAVAACGQGTAPKPSAADYPVHTEAGGIAIGAEYMVHSFGSGEQMYVVENFLVVEVALFPPKGSPERKWEPRDFALRINGKNPLGPQPPTMVAATLNHPEWRQKPALDVGAGPVMIGIGHPPNQGPFPGAPAPQPRYPNPPRVENDSARGTQKQAVATPAELLVQTALPEDAHRGPVSGFLYFPFSGKTSSIKSLELTWEGASLKLR